VQAAICRDRNPRVEASELSQSTFPRKPLFGNLATHSVDCGYVGKLREPGNVVGDHLDISDGPDKRPGERIPGERIPGEKIPAGKRFVGIHFACCEIYSRIYINSSETGYEGHCPKCSKRVHLRIGSGGTETRFFTAR
jgi:hypothetical protein